MSEFLRGQAIDDAAGALVDVIEAQLATEGRRLKSFAIIAVATDDSTGDSIGCMESGCSCGNCTRNMIKTFAEARGATVERTEDDSPAQVLHS